MIGGAHSDRNSFVRKKSETSTQIDANTTVRVVATPDRGRAALHVQAVAAADQGDLEAEEERLAEAAA